LAKDLKSYEEYVKILLLQFEELYHSLDSAEVQDAFHTLKRRAVINHVENEKHQLSRDLQSAEGDELRKLLEKDKILNNLLNTYKD
jgi:hypothetical protein